MSEEQSVIPEVTLEVKEERKEEEAEEEDDDTVEAHIDESVMTVMAGEADWEEPTQLDASKSLGKISSEVFKGPRQVI